MGIDNIIPRIKRSFLKTGSKLSGNRKHSTPEVYNHGEIKLLIIGNDNVGKMSICQTYVGHSSDESEEANHVFDTSVFITINDEPRQYDMELFLYNPILCKHDKEEYKKALMSADGFMLVYSSYSKESFINLFEIISDIRHLTHGKFPIVILGNETEKDSLKEVTQNDVITFQYKQFDVDTKKNEGIQEAFTYLVRQCINVKDTSTKNHLNTPELSRPPPSLRSKSLTPFTAQTNSDKSHGKRSLQH